MTNIAKNSLKTHYTELYQKAVNSFRTRGCKLDKWLDDNSDNRFGLALVIYPDGSLKNKIQEFVSTLQAVDPNQYYYPPSNIHLTVMSIISCYDGFDWQTIPLKKYIDKIKECVPPKGFEIEIHGITAAPKAIMLQGFPQDNTLNAIRTALRVNFDKSDLEQSLDKRYKLKTAHFTVARFRKELAKTEAFLQQLENYRDYDFGSLKVSSLELVYTDWYHRQAKVEKLYKFELS